MNVNGFEILEDILTTSGYIWLFVYYYLLGVFRYKSVQYFHTRDEEDNWEFYVQSEQEIRSEPNNMTHWG